MKRLKLRVPVIQTKYLEDVLRITTTMGDIGFEVSIADAYQAWQLYSGQFWRTGWVNVDCGKLHQFSSLRAYYFTEEEPT